MGGGVADFAIGYSLFRYLPSPRLRSPQGLRFAKIQVGDHVFTSALAP